MVSAAACFLPGNLKSQCADCSLNTAGTISLVGEMILERGQQKRPELAFEPGDTGERSVFQQVQEKTLGQVLGLFRAVLAAAGEPWHEKQMQNSPEHFATAEMLVNLYFPELLPKFQTLKSAADRVSEIHYKLERVIDNNENPSELRDPFLDRIKDFRRTANELKKSICERGRRLNLLGNKDNQTGAPG